MTPLTAVNMRLEEVATQTVAPLMTPSPGVAMPLLDPIGTMARESSAR